MLECLAESASQAQICVIFDDEFGAPWTHEVHSAFTSKFGSRVHIRQEKKDPKLHAKVLWIIGKSEYAIVGSSNLTKAGYGADTDKLGNQEASVRVEDPSEIKTIDRWWNQLWEATGDYAHPSDNMNPYLQLEAHATGTGARREPADNPDEETLRTAPDSLTSLKQRILCLYTTPRPADQFRDYQREILSDLGKV